MNEYQRLRNESVPNTIGLAVHNAEGGPWYTIADVARKIEVSPSTIRKWYRKYAGRGIPPPTRHMRFGKLKVAVYDEQRIAELVQWANENIIIGRPTKERDG